MNTKIQNLWEEVRDLSLGTTQISHLHSPPTPLEFLRSFISPNKPLLISNAVSHWAATTSWTSTSYLVDALSTSSVSLHLTPTGKADSITRYSVSSRVFDDAHVDKIAFGGVLDGVGVGDLEKGSGCARSECEGCEDCVSSPDDLDNAHVDKIAFGGVLDGVGVGSECEDCEGLGGDCDSHGVFDDAHVDKIAFGGVLDGVGVGKVGGNGFFRSEGCDSHGVFEDAHVDEIPFGGVIDELGVGKVGENGCVRSECKDFSEDCENCVTSPGVLGDERVDKVVVGGVVDDVSGNGCCRGECNDLEQENDCFRGECKDLESEVEKVGNLEQGNNCFRSECNGFGVGCENCVSSNSPALVFAFAHVEKVPFDKSLDVVLESEVNSRVGYLQQQNDCFRSEYKGLSKDCDHHVPWASEALGCLPEAVNLWIGNGLSETSFHKDHYENLYVVITGEKHFLLLPPTDVHRMYVKEYPAAQYHYSQDTEEFRLELEDPVRYVPWCSVNPYPSEAEKEKALAEFPLYFNGPKPFEVTVKAGQMLYLPSMWFHHVRQTPDERGLTVAINYWYDMRFDIKYAYFNFLQSIQYSPPKNSASSNVACKKEFQGEEEEDPKIRESIEN